MTDTDPIEQRLRRTFQYVAEQPVTPLGDPEPWRTGAARSPSRRRLRVTGGALVIVVVIALIVLGITYGPRQHPDHHQTQSRRHRAARRAPSSLLSDRCRTPSWKRPPPP